MKYDNFKLESNKSVVLYPIKELSPQVYALYKIGDGTVTTDDDNNIVSTISNTDIKEFDEFLRYMANVLNHGIVSISIGGQFGVANYSVASIAHYDTINDYLDDIAAISTTIFYGQGTFKYVVDDNITYLCIDLR